MSTENKINYMEAEMERAYRECPHSLGDCGTDVAWAIAWRAAIDAHCKRALDMLLKSLKDLNEMNNTEDSDEQD